MESSQLLLLNSKQLQQKIDRIAYQILEDNLDETEIVLAGIWERGYKVALRLATVLREISALNIILLRIDLERDRTKLVATTDLEENTWCNKVIILVDDVLNSGKTLAYGFGVFLNTPHKKIRTVVLIDRSHKSYPIATDYVGLELATLLKEHVEVVMDVEGEVDRVFLS